MYQIMLLRLAYSTRCNPIKVIRNLYLHNSVFGELLVVVVEVIVIVNVVPETPLGNISF